MPLDNAWLDEQLADAERSPRFSEWNATSFAHMITIMGGGLIDGDDAESPRPTAAQQARAARLLVWAVALRPIWEPRTDARMHRAVRWARAAVKVYKQHPGVPFTDAEWKALQAQCGGSIN